MTTNEQRKIRIGRFDYPLSFLSNLIDSVRDERPSFSSDMLRMWEDSESARIQEEERDAHSRTLGRQVEQEAKQEYKSE